MYKSEVVGKGGIRARVVADSISEQGIRLCTLELRYPRFILAELNTHRMLSKSSSSSRAIPVKKMIEQVCTDPAMPIHWGKNKPGMQADGEIQHAMVATDIWRTAGRLASEVSKELSTMSLHKQVSNRLLEPFQFMNTVVTATEWGNFFFLRDHRDAQPEFRELARCMKQAMLESTPRTLSIGMWHTPYVGYEVKSTDSLKVSAARCARVSFMNHNNENPDVESDLDLFNILATRPYKSLKGVEFSADDPIHMSPTEHQGKPMRPSNTDPDNLHDRNDPSNFYTWDTGISHADRNGNLWSGNLKGWIQHRKLLEEKTCQ